MLPLFFRRAMKDKVSLLEVAFFRSNVLGTARNRNVISAYFIFKALQELFKKSAIARKELS